MRKLLMTSLLLTLFTPRVHAEAPVQAPIATTDTGAEEADVEKIKEKYWAKGNETEMGVVQNRLYPKRHRIELGLNGSFVSGDPFLNIKTFGGSLGFHFSEFFALHAVGWTASVGPSSALTTLQDQLGATTATNGPKSYYGLEGRASILYGKLSLMGSAILYFDAYFSGSAGRITTDSGTNMLFSGGVGQQIHLSRTFALNFDYKLMYYNELVGTRQTKNLSSAITLGISVFMNLFGAD